MKLLVLVLSFTCLSNFVRSQNDFLRGRIFEKGSNNPISYATIKFSSGKSNTISNNEGDFLLNIPTTSLNDSVLISSIGYLTLKIDVQSALSHDSKVFFLVKNNILLNEIVILPSNAIAILKEAVRTSTTNYPSPAIMKGYYREFVKRDSFITKYADGLVDYYIEKNKNNNPKVSLQVMESRVKEIPVPDGEDKFDSFNSLIDITSIGEFASPGVCKVLDSANFIYYDYKISEINEASRSLYLITFNPKEGRKEALYQGKIYIDKETSLIMALNYQISPVSAGYVKTMSLLGYKINVNSSNVCLLYAINKGKYNLLYACRNSGMKISSKRVNQITTFKSEFQVTEILTENVFPFVGKLYTKSTLYKNGNKYTHDFWQNNNFSLNTREELEFIKNNKEEGTVN